MEPSNQVKAMEAARDVVDDLHTRRGLRQELERMDEDVREEIVQTLAGLIGRRFLQPAPAVPDAVRQLPEKWRAYPWKHDSSNIAYTAFGRAMDNCADELDDALATHPAPADRPEPSEALEAFERAYKRANFNPQSVGKLLSQRDVDVIRQALSQPAPAVPPMNEDDEQTVNRLVQEARKGEESYPINGDSPAVPEYVRQRLWKIHSVLDRALGDTDCDWFETDDEMREEVPVQWAAKEIAHLAAAPTPYEGETNED